MRAVEPRADARLICLACGTELPSGLADVGSLRCHDCRAHGAPLWRRYVGEAPTASHLARKHAAAPGRAAGR